MSIHHQTNHLHSKILLKYLNLSANLYSSIHKIPSSLPFHYAYLYAWLQIYVNTHHLFWTPTLTDFLIVRSFPINFPPSDLSTSPIQ